MANLKESYTTLAVQIDKIQAGLDKQKMVLMKDVAMFDGLFEKNLEYFKQLQLYIQAGEEKLQELNEVTIPKLEADAQLSDNPMAHQVVQDFKNSVIQFEKKVHDLKLSKMIAIQTAPQIRIIKITTRFWWTASKQPSTTLFHCGKTRWFLPSASGVSKKRSRCSKLFPKLPMSS